MLRAGLSEYAKQRLVRIQPTLDDHVGYGEFTSQVSERCVGSDVVSTQTRNEDLLESAIRSDHLHAVLYDSQTNHELFIYICRGGIESDGRPVTAKSLEYLQYWSFASSVLVPLFKIKPYWPRQGS